MQDYAKVVRWLVDEVYPHADYIRLVQDHKKKFGPRFGTISICLPHFTRREHFTVQEM